MLIEQLGDKLAHLQHMVSTPSPVVANGGHALLSSIEAINGMILFGWSTAFIFAVIRRVYSQIYPAAAES